MTAKIMTKEKIAECNILMAEFVGLKKGMLGEYTNPLLDKPNKEGFIQIYIPNGSDMRFHESFDWLFLVVEKIESLGFDVAISSKKGFRPDLGITVPYVCDITSQEHGNIETLVGSNKIAIVYGTCLHFIKWFNKQ